MTPAGLAISEIAGMRKNSPLLFAPPPRRHLGLAGELPTTPGDLPERKHTVGHTSRFSRLRVLLPVLALLLASIPARADFVCEGPGCEDVTVPLPAGVAVPESTVRIFLPDGHAAPDCARRYPVLYLLHGAGDTYRTWSENTDAFDLTRALDLIVVMPDGGRNAEAGWYSDWKDGSRQWETFHTEVLVDFADQTYCTLGDGHRAVAGLSMGGFGAMKYAARHPGLYAAAASFSGALDILHGAPASGAVFLLAGPFVGTPGEGVWGNQATDRETWEAHNPRSLAPSLTGTTLFLTTGNGLPGGAHDDPTDPAYAPAPPDPVEHGVWQMNVVFRRALDEAEVPFRDNFYGPGRHGWSYWRDAFAWALPQVLAATRE